MRLMVLGGGSCQLNLIKRAKKEGHFVVVADYLPDCPAREFADIHVPVSTFDLDGVLSFAKRHQINAIVTTGTDQPVLTAALAAKALDLPFYIDGQTALAVTNKRVMKELFQKHGIPTAKYRLIGPEFTDPEINGMRFPAVLKPVDSQGQRGIFLVNSVDEVRQNIGETLRFSREKKALLEEYYKSDEITVNGWAAEGKAAVISVVDRLTIKQTRHIGVCFCHHYPSLHVKRYRDEIEALTAKIVNAFGIRNGPIYFQYLIGSEGIKVNEIAARIGGAYEDLTIPILSSIDILGLLLEYVQKGRCDLAKLTGYHMGDREKFVSTQLFFCRPGKVAFLTPAKQITDLPYVRDYYCAYKEGSVIPSIENATARAGYAIIEGNSFEDMTAKIDEMFEKLSIKDIRGNDLVIKYRDYSGKYSFLECGETE